MKQNYWIAFEGGEGSGKSTQAILLKRALEKKSCSAIQTREPGGTEKAEKIRQLLTEPQNETWDPVTELYLHVAARREHVMKCIRPALNAGQWVICDRFSPSTIAYQAYGGGLAAGYVWAVIHTAIGATRPDLTIWLDSDVQQGLSRAHNRNETNHYETKDSAYHERVRQGYKACLEQFPEWMMHISVGTLDRLTIHQQIITLLNNRFDCKLEPCDTLD